MNEAPKKIWVDPLFWHSDGGTYTDHGVEIQKTPYIRADIVDELVKALERLARLGNGNNYGNSIGNEIARAALAKARGESND